VGEGGFFGNSLPSALITRHLEVAVRVKLPGNTKKPAKLFAPELLA